jgi:hypothetical protein
MDAVPKRRPQAARTGACNTIVPTLSLTIALRMFQVVDLKA